MKLDDLIALDVYNDRFNRHFRGWENVNNLFHAEGCKYQFFIGRKQEIGEFPPAIAEFLQSEARKSSPCARYLTGKEAYSYTLQILCGLENEDKLGDSQIVSDVKRGWQQFQEYHPEIAQDMFPIIQHIFSDIRSVRSEFLENGKLFPEGHEPALTARNILTLTPSSARAGSGSSVLLVCESVAHASVVAKILGKHVGELLITHPDPASQREIEKDLGQLQREKKITAAVTPVKFRDVLDYLQSADHVFVDYPIGKNAAVDDALVNGWNMRDSESAGYIVHLKGCPEQRRAMAAPWDGLANLITPEALLEEQKAQKKANKKQFEKARVGCDNCAESRMRGKQPIKSHLDKPTEEYMHLSGLASTASRSRA